MIKIFNVSEFHLENGDPNIEILIFFEYGDPDCIDLEKLTTIQTIKFLKNIAEILESTYNVTKMSNNNISLENIILVDSSQLKLSGWKPHIQ